MAKVDIRLPASIITLAKALASKSGLTFSDVIRQFIEAGEASLRNDDGSYSFYNVVR